MAPQGQDDARDVLTPLNVPQNIKADAWDAYHQSQDEATFTKRFKTLNLPNETKAALWDKRWGKQQQALPRNFPPLRQQTDMERLKSGWNRIKDTASAIYDMPSGTPLTGPLPSLRSIVEVGNKPLVSAGQMSDYGRFIFPPLLFVHTAITDAEKIKADPKSPQWAKELASVSSGIAKGEANALSGLTSPFNLAMLFGGSLIQGGSMLVKATKALTSLGFGEMMVNDLITQSYEAYKAIKDGDLERAAEAITGGVVTTVFASLSAKHAITEGAEAINAGRQKPAASLAPAPEPATRITDERRMLPPVRPFGAQTDILEPRGTNMEMRVLPAEVRKDLESAKQYLSGSAHPELSGKLTQPGVRVQTEEEAVSTLARLKRLKAGVSLQSQVEVQNGVGEQEKVSQNFAALEPHVRREIDSTIKELEGKLDPVKVAAEQAKSRPRMGYYEGQKEAAGPGRIPPPLGWHTELLRAETPEAAIEQFKRYFPDSTLKQRARLRSQWTAAQIENAPTLEKALENGKRYFPQLTADDVRNAWFKEDPKRQAKWLFEQATPAEARDHYKTVYPGADAAQLQALMSIWQAAKDGKYDVKIEPFLTGFKKTGEAASGGLGDWGKIESRLEDKGSNPFSPFALVRLNAYAKALYSLLLTGGDDGWAGLNHGPHESALIWRVLKSYAIKASLVGQTQEAKAVNELAEHIKLAVAQNGDAGTIIVDDAEPPSSIPSVVMHESVHGVHRIIGGGTVAHTDTPAAIAHPVTFEIRDALDALAYPPDALKDPDYIITEGVAHILDGENLLQLPLQHEIDWIENYRESLRKKLGARLTDANTPDIVKGYFDAVDNHIAKGREKLRGTAQALQGVDEGIHDRGRPGAGRGPDEAAGTVQGESNVPAAVKALMQRRGDPGDPWYLKSERLITEKMGGAMDARSFEAFLKNSGIKNEELEELGLQRLIDAGGKIMKQQALDTIRANDLDIHEVLYGGGPKKSSEPPKPTVLQPRRALWFPATNDRGNQVWYSRIGAGGSRPNIYTIERIIEGATADPDAAVRYEVTYPSGNESPAFSSLGEAQENAETHSGLFSAFNTLRPPVEHDKPTQYARWTTPGPSQNYGELIFTLPDRERMPPNAPGYRLQRAYTHGHWGQSVQNPFAHVRFSERVDAEGKRTLLIDEVQSDAAREEAGLPFSKDWHEFVMKRMLRWAAERGFDRLAWTPGEHQADRYSLVKAVAALHYDADKKVLRAIDAYGRDQDYNDVTPDKLPEYIGKEYTQKLLAPENKLKSGTEYYTIRNLEGVKMGGEWAKALYDRAIPRFLDKYIRKWGSKVSATRLPAHDKSLKSFHSIDLTSELKEAALIGQPLFKRRGLTEAPKREGKEFYSPNVYENLNFDEALKRLESRDHARLRSFAEDVDRQLELKATHEDAVGDWHGGAENAMITTIKGTDWDTLKYSAALKGKFASQNVVIPFLADPQGGDFLIEFEVRKGEKASANEYTMDDVRDVLDGAGIQHRTIIPRGDKIGVMIFQGGGRPSDLATLAKRVGDRFGIKQKDLSLTRGRGEFLGDESDRDAAGRIYDAAIREFEQRHPDRRYVYGRDASAGGVGIYPPRPGEGVPFIEAEHRTSKEGLKTLKTDKAGTGLAGAERARVKVAPDLKGRIYLTEKGKPVEGAFRHAAHTYDATLNKDNFYDVTEDKDGFIAKARELTAQRGARSEAQVMTELERLIKQEGYQGWIERDGRIISFANIPVQERIPMGDLEDFLDHGEKQFTAAEKKKILETIQKIPSVQQFIAAAKAGAIGRYWYERATKVFEALQESAPDVFKPEDKDRFTKVVAALSPQTPVREDLVNSLLQWKRWTDAGRPMDRPTLNKLFKNVMQGWRLNLIRALLGERLSGPKVTQFAPALRGIKGPVVNDTWMALFSGIDGTKLDQRGVYEAVAVRIRQAADQLGWSPEEAQASIWTFIKTLSELTGRNSMRPPEEVLKIMSSEDMTRLGADMAGIMLREDIQNQLEELGVPLDELRKRIEQLEFPKAEPGGIEAVDRNLLKFAAKRLETTPEADWDRLARKSEAIGQGTLFSKEKYEAGKRTLAKLLTSQAGEATPERFDPEAFKALVDVGGYLVERGMRNFKEWSKQMVHEFGEIVRPHLDQIWKEVKGTSAEAKKGGMTPPPKAKAAPPAKLPPSLPPVPAGLRPAQVGESILRSFGGRLNRDIAVKIEQLFKTKERLEKLSAEEALQWSYKMEEPDKMGAHAAPEDKQVADFMRKELDRDRDDLVRTGKLKHFIENYWPHDWEDAASLKEGFSRLLGKRPLAGRGGFLKTRTIPTLREGVEVYGKKPISYNPVDQFFLRHVQIRRYVLAFEAFEDYKRTGLALEDDGKTQITEGWQPYNDKFTGGKWYGPPDAVRVFNNFVSPGLLGPEAGANFVMDLVRRFNNATALLSVSASLFHVSMTSGVSVMSQVALAAKNIHEGAVKVIGSPVQAVRGKPLRAAEGVGQIGRGLHHLARAPISVALDLKLGRRARTEYMKPGSHPEIAELMDKAVDAGFRMPTRQETMDFLYNNSSMRMLKTAIKDGRYGTALVRSIPALLEKAARPVMVHWVPLLKSAAVLHAIEDELYNMQPDVLKKLGPGVDLVGKGTPSLWEQRDKLGRVVDEMDNRYGQMIADNLFWNKKFRDATLLTFRFTDYNFGNTRMLLGDIPKAITHRSLEPTILGDIRDLITKNKMSHRLAFTFVALPFVTVLMNGLMQSLVFKQPEPENAKDLQRLLIGAKTGRNNPDGTPELISMVGYAKTMIGFAKPIQNIATGHPLEALPQVKDLAKAHMSGSLQLIWEAGNNEDFWRHEKLHESNLPGLKGEAKELWQFSSHVVESMGPMGLRDVMQYPVRPGDSIPLTVARRAGLVQRPPISLGREKWQQAIVDASAGHNPQAPQEPGAYDKYQSKLDWEESIMNKTKTVSDMMRAAAKGEITQKDALDIVRKNVPGYDYFMDRYHGLGIEDALNIFEMVPEDDLRTRNKMKNVLRSKEYLLYKVEDKNKREALRERFKSAIKPTLFTPPPSAQPAYQENR